MASYSSLLSEEHVMCSICLEVFNKPVSIPCGHTFCKVCIRKYWDTTPYKPQCPLCKDTFYIRPKLLVNTTLRDLVEHVKRINASDEEKSPARPGEVLCDVCTGRKLKALNSCLRCETSYCETHLEPHLRVAGLKKHKLIHPVENLEEKMGKKKHNKPLELFWRKHQTCVCLDIEREISDSVLVFAALMSSIERSQAEFIQVMERKQKALEKQAQRFIQDLEQEITELKRSAELQKLLHSEDDLLLPGPPHLLIPEHMVVTTIEDTYTFSSLSTWL